MTGSLGDFAVAAVLDFKFTTVDDTGLPTTLAGSPVVSAYKDNSTTQGTTGVTLSVDFDGVTGLHNVRVDTSADGSFFSAGSCFDIVITVGTVDGVSVVGYVVGRFSLEKSSALMPTVAGRKLDVSAAGEAGLDWANIGSPATAQNLSATNIDVDQVVASVSGAVGSVTAGVTLAASAVQAIWDALTSALTTVGSVGKLLVDNVNATISSRSSHSAADVWAAGTRTLTSFGTLAADVWAVATRVLTAGTNIVLAKGTGVTGFNDPTVGAIADQVWDETLADHLGAGSTGSGLNAAGSAGDPWATALPGAYGAGSAGKIVGDNLNATVSSRSSHSAADVWASGTRTLTSFGTLVADTATAIWAAVTRTLTAATNITSTGGTTFPQTGDSFARLGAPAGASVSADIATKATPAQVNAEVVDALAVDTYAEPGQGAPAATTTLAAKLNYLYKLTRNKKDNDGTQTRFYADDATTVDHKQTVAESAGTVTKGEIATGP